jgi:hypothetical protein
MLQWKKIWRGIVLYLGRRVVEL